MQPSPSSVCTGKCQGVDTENSPRRSESSLGEIAASYGIQHYPTQVLIDRRGRVIGKFNIKNELDLNRLESILVTH
jgi:hypothetical protein